METPVGIVQHPIGRITDASCSSAQPRSGRRDSAPQTSDVAAGVLDSNGEAGVPTEGKALAEKVSGGGGHTDPVAEILLAITIILLAAKIAGDLFERIHMPRRSGELTVGILLATGHSSRVV